jgi:hypothetical protein
MHLDSEWRSSSDSKLNLAEIIPDPLSDFRSII